MKIVSETPAAELSAKQRDALIHLLGDDDAAVYQSVRAKLVSCGPPVSAWLQPHLLSSDPLLRRRSQEIVDFFARQEADTAFLSFCLKQGEEFDVEEGVWRLAKTRYPNINIAAYSAWLDSFATDLRVKLKGQSGRDPEQTLALINEFIFSQMGFSGNEQDYYAPENSYLNRVLDRRTGNPISLSLVYLLVARRLQLPIAGIGLPGHFICRWQNSRKEIYIDAFNRGKLLTKTDCVKYLLRLNQGLDGGHLSPVSARRILLRICANLHQTYTQLEAKEEIFRLQRYLVALAK